MDCGIRKAFHATLDNAVCGIRDKMIRRHPYVFGEGNKMDNPEEVPGLWEEIKKKEKEGKEGVDGYLSEAFQEAVELIDRARKRKGY